jgi:hypothetical protein
LENNINMAVNGTLTASVESGGLRIHSGGSSTKLQHGGGNPDQTYTLPTNPQNGYILETNASGLLSWVAPSSGVTNKIFDSDDTTNIEILEDEKIKMKIGNAADKLVLSNESANLVAKTDNDMIITLTNDDKNMVLRSSDTTDTIKLQVENTHTADHNAYKISELVLTNEHSAQFNTKLTSSISPTPNNFKISELSAVGGTNLQMFRTSSNAL